MRTVVASTADGETFGWPVAAGARRRGPGRAQAGGSLCDWQGGYPYGAAQAAFGEATAAAWSASGRGSRGARWARSGRAEELLAELRAARRGPGAPPPGGPRDDPRRVAAEAVGPVGGNRGRMDSPRYRRPGLPASRAAVGGAIERINRRAEGAEPSWLEGGAEAVRQARAAELSEGGRAEDDGSRPRPRPRARAAGRGSFRPAS